MEPFILNLESLAAFLMLPLWWRLWCRAWTPHCLIRETGIFQNGLGE